VRKVVAEYDLFSVKLLETAESAVSEGLLELWIHADVRLLDAPVNEILSRSLLAVVEVGLECMLPHFIIHPHEQGETLLAQSFLFAWPRLFQVVDHRLPLVVPEQAQDLHANFVHQEDLLASYLHLLAFAHRGFRLIH